MFTRFSARRASAAIAALVVALAMVGLQAQAAGEVTTSGHWIQFGSKNVMLVGDSVTQGWMECGTNFNQTGYVDALASRGINMLMIWSYIGITDQVADVRIGYNAPEIWPWNKSGGVFNLDSLNDAYFTRLRSLVEHCNEHGIVFLITIHDGWTKTRFDGHPFKSGLGGSLTDKSQYVELADYNNEMPTTYNPSWTRQQKHQYWLEKYCGRIISSTSDLPNVIYEMFNEGEWYNQANLANFEKHFLNFFKTRSARMTINNGETISTTNFRNVTNCDVISLHQPNWNSGTNATDSYNYYAPKWSGSPVKPYYFSEPVPEYRGDSSLHTALTRLMWGTVLAGAGFVVQNDCSFGWDPNCLIASEATDRNTVYDREGHCCRFFNQTVQNLGGMSPQGGLSSTGVCFANPGSEYVVWSQGANFTLNLSALSGSAACRFYNPRSGSFQSVFYKTGGSTQSFTVPDSNDWALYVIVYYDTQAPSIPTNVTATAQSETSIQVTWTASTDNVGVTGYKVFRNGAQVGTSATTSYPDSGLSPWTVYSYTVSAYDAAGNNSAQSSPAATARTLDSTAPSVPTNVTATAETPKMVKVTWTASTDNVGITGYKIFRNGNPTPIGTSTTTDYTDTGCSPDTTYSYTVSAYDAAGNNSAQSSPAATAATMQAMDIAAAKQLPDLSEVGFVSKIVTAIYSDCFYVEESERNAGIKVVPFEMPDGLSIGGTVDVGGVIQTVPGGERRIAGAVVSVH